MTSHREQAIQLLRDNYERVGVVFEDHIDDDTLYTETDGDRVIGAAVTEHLPNVTMVHQLAVHEDYRRNGIANDLVHQIARESPHAELEAKAHVGSDANAFFEATGWNRMRRTGDGRMNVWRRDA